MVKEINDVSFDQEVINSGEVVVVDFWAPWCQPCKMLAPVMEELSGELEGKVKFVKVNTDENPVASERYRISSIPTVMVFKNGMNQEALIGFRPKQAIKDGIEKYL